MAWLYHFNQIVTHGMEGFLETAVPLISGLAEIIGLFIIVTSLVKATYHYVRATFFHGQHDFLHEMSSGLTTALEFLMSAEIAKTLGVAQGTVKSRLSRGRERLRALLREEEAYGF
mgnify:CR=1 FL=1